METKFTFQKISGWLITRLQVKDHYKKNPKIFCKKTCLCPPPPPPQTHMDGIVWEGAYICMQPAYQSVCTPPPLWESPCPSSYLWRIITGTHHATASLYIKVGENLNFCRLGCFLRENFSARCYFLLKIEGGWKQKLLCIAGHQQWKKRATDDTDS
jgi:hypothetical protein